MRRGTYYGPQTSNGVRRFRRIRLGFLAANPLCVECAKRNILEPSTVLDHKIPHRGDVDLFWDSNNWQALCKPCHDRKSARESDAGIRGENHAR
jgi:5-methylcytosine-specific restriction protein A